MSLKNCSLRSSCSIIRETRLNSFHSLEVLPFFLKNLCFQQLLRCLKVSLISYTAMVEKASGPLYIDPRGLSHSIVLGKTSQIFCHCEDSSFLKSLFLSTS